MQIPNLSDIPDLEPVSEDEYNLKIVSAQDTISGNTGREGIKMVIYNLDKDNALPIFHSIWLPMEGDDDTKAQTMWRMIKEFLISLGLNPGDISTEELQGIEFTGLVGLQKNNLSGADENVLKRVTG